MKVTITNHFIRRFSERFPKIDCDKIIENLNKNMNVAYVIPSAEYKALYFPQTGAHVPLVKDKETIIAKTIQFKFVSINSNYKFKLKKVEWCL